MITEWGLRTISGEVIACRDRKHAEALLKSESVVLGPKRGREVVLRQVTMWGAA